ncbi:MAG TPA: PilZ domain-containing protein [Candidatus Nitrosotenuis sp.]|nr:PilZ domain-containing protein [Candidatus Nitrosotenuis sp.]
MFAEDERRRYPRYGFQADVEIEFEGKTFRSFITDISIAGSFVVAANPFWMGAKFRMKLLVGEPFSVDCVVRRVAMNRGMGVSFESLSKAAEERLDRLIATLAV